jgi:hypothetical protein
LLVTDQRGSSTIKEARPNTFERLNSLFLIWIFSIELQSQHLDKMPPVNRIISWLLAVTLGSLASASAIGTWELTEFTRSLSQDGQSCDYSFNIIEYDIDGTSSGPTFCTFQVHAPNGIQPTQNSFYDIPCDSATNYHASGGWDPAGFITMTVQNKEENYDSFFGYRDVDLANGAIIASQASLAYVVGSLRPRSVTDTEIEKLESEQNGPPVGNWSVSNLVRSAFLALVSKGVVIHERHRRH